eukprot:gene6126-10135_t
MKENQSTEPPKKKIKLSQPLMFSNLKVHFDEEVAEYLKQHYGKEHFENICKSLCLPPSITTIRVNNPIDMESSKKEIFKFFDEKYEIQIHETIPDCLCLPVVGPNEDIKLLENFVVVGQKCGEAVLRGAHCFAPGVIGISKYDKNVSILCQIDDKIKIPRGKKFQNEDIDENFLFIGNGLLKMDHSSIFHTIKTGIAVETKECIFSSSSLNDLDSAKYFVQNLPSMIVTHVLDPNANEKVLDMCAAPGGKTSHLCNIMKFKQMMETESKKENGEVFAFDKNRSKIKILQKIKKEQNLENLQIFKQNATTALKDGYSKESFDKILLDAPCSGLGLRPIFNLNNENMNFLKECSSYQKRLLKEAVGLLKKNGTLVYSVCTLNPMEGEENVNFATKELGLELVDIDKKYKKYATHGCC